jgi:uncharacterized membrane protein
MCNRVARRTLRSACTDPTKETMVSHHKHDDVSTYTTFAAAYDSLDDAKADYKAIKLIYENGGGIDTFDAAIITRDEHGKVKIAADREEPAIHGGWAGAGIGLAVGAVIALFPAVSLPVGLLAGTGGGAVLGTLAGHVSGGMSRKDLKDLGELLDDGESGLVVVAATDWTARVEGSFSKAPKVMSKDLRADKEVFRAAVDDLREQSKREQPAGAAAR